jgi:uncharacterized membrane-anchored protein YitT (DUF2179 family)
MATAIQAIGAALIVAGIGLFSIPAAVIVAGVAAVLFGIALERN